MSVAQWSRDIDVNLTEAFRVIQACLPGMRERRFGRVIAISSMAGWMGAAGKVAYAASKAGLHGMMRTVAIENCAHGITANSVLPEMIATPKMLTLPRTDQERICNALPSGRFGRPEEVADLGLFPGPRRRRLPDRPRDRHRRRPGAQYSVRWPDALAAPPPRLLSEGTAFGARSRPAVPHSVPRAFARTGPDS